MADLFKLFKEITKEEEKIIYLINSNIQINSTTSILDIGSNSGYISRKLQPAKNKITLIDIEEFKIPKDIKFIKSSWENADIIGKYDLILASHVWGHFGYKNIQQIAFNKMIKHKEENGKITLVYNINSDFLSKLIDFSKNLFKDFQYDYFNENIIKDYNKKEIVFEVEVKAKNFSSLAELVKILIILDESKYNKSQVENFLSTNLKKPEFKVEQKIVIIE